MSLKYYWGVLRKRKWTIIQAALIVSVVAVTIGSLLGSSYKGVAVILVSEQDPVAALLGTTVPELSTQPERSLQTQVELIQLQPMLQQVIDELGLDLTTDELADKVSVSPEGQANLLTVEARDEDPQVAADIANALANAYVEWARDLKASRVEAAKQGVMVVLSEAQADLAEIAKARLEGTYTDNCEARVTIAADRYAGLQSQLDELRISDYLEGAGGSIVASATVDSKRVSPKPVRDAAIGLVVGLLFGVGIAFVTENLDEESADDASRDDED